jgi:hypothetical protein
MASTGSRTLYNDEPFPPDQIVEAICQLQHNNQNAKMVIILFGKHSSLARPKAIKADDDSVDISFGAMTIRYKYKSPQAWMTNNWESYFIICFGSPKEVVFHLSPELPSSVLLPNHLLLSSLATILSTMLSSLLMPCIVSSRCSPILVLLLARTLPPLLLCLKRGMPLPLRQTSLSGSVLKIMLKRLSTDVESHAHNTSPHLSVKKLS